jgi:diguanylate cyclase (GGDEF)-like protein
VVEPETESTDLPAAVEHSVPETAVSRPAVRDEEKPSPSARSGGRAERTDALTWLFNRKVFDDELHRLISRVRAGAAPGSLLRIDVDDFQKYHAAPEAELGNSVLRHVAAVVRKTVLGADALPARYGEEELAVLFGPGKFEKAKKLAGDIRAAVEQSTFQHGDQERAVTISAGLARVDGQLSQEEVVVLAHRALRAAQAAGSNNCFFHDGLKCVAMQTGAPGEKAPAGKSARDRRQHLRRDFRARHRIARYVPGELPAPEDFFEAQFHDLSAAGCSMLLPEDPANGHFLVALDKPGGLIHVAAEVVNCRKSSESNEHGEPLYLVGCRFTGRVALAQSEPMLAGT